jgi:hypothetical protein
MNRGQLALAIMAWLHRASFLTPVASAFDAVAGFIALCEQAINDSLRARCMVVRVQQPVEGQYMTLPCDYLEMLDARIVNGPPLNYMARSDLAQALYEQYNASPGNWQVGTQLAPDYTPQLTLPAYPWNGGLPRNMNIIGGEIEFSPFPMPNPNQPPGQIQTWPICEMAYYQRVGLGMDDTDTNNVLLTYPAIYIFGSLIHSAPFLRDDGRAKMWGDMFSSAVAMANAEHERSRSAGGRLVQRFRPAA